MKPLPQTDADFSELIGRTFQSAKFLRTVTGLVDGDVEFINQRGEKQRVFRRSFKSFLCGATEIGTLEKMFPPINLLTLQAIQRANMDTKALVERTLDDIDKGFYRFEPDEIRQICLALKAQLAKHLRYVLAVECPDGSEAVYFADNADVLTTLPWNRARWIPVKPLPVAVPPKPEGGGAC